MNITKQQWSQLKDEQKNAFQDEVCKKFRKNEYPSWGEVHLFLLKRNLINDSLGDYEIPPAEENIDVLWEKVLNYFHNKNNF